MNNRQPREIGQTTETEVIQNHEPRKLNSTVTLHPKITYGAFVMNYIDELQTEINKLSKENVYLQSDEYLNTIFPTNYIQDLKDKIEELEKENKLLKKQNAQQLNPKSTYTESVDPWKTYAGGVNPRLTLAGGIDPRATLAGGIDPKATYGGYNSSYVKELQNQLTKITEENFYYKSEEYKKKLTGSHSKEKKSLIRKIQRLSLLIQQLSYDSMERENILGSLKEILENKSEAVIRSTIGSFDIE
jgi:hypothetical protein